MGKKAQELLKARKKKTSKESKIKVWGSISPQTDLDNLRLSHGGSGIDREYDRLSNLTMSDVKGWNSPDTVYRSPSLSMTSDRVQEWINRYNADVDKEAEKAGERGAATAAMSPGVSSEASRSKYRENFKSENKIKGLDENGKAVFSGDKNLPKNAIIDRVFNDDKLSDGEKSYLLYDVFGYTTQDTDAYGNTPERYEAAYKIKTAKGENKAQSWYTMKSDDGKEFKLSGEAKDAVDRDLDNGVTKNALHLTPTGYTPKSKEEAEAIDAYRTMRMSERKAEQKKQADEERRKNMSTGEKVVSTLKMLDADVSRGVSGFTRGFWSTLDMLTLHQIPIIGDFHKAAVDTDEYLNRVAQEGADNLGGGGWHLFNNITQETSRNVVRMLPLILTGGTSAAGEGAVALSTQGQNAAAAIARNPNFIMTLTEMLGPAYDEAKEKGANELQAYSYALTAGTLNALVEIGGGVDVLPTQIRQAGGKTAKEMIKDWAKSAVEEGNEEVVQGIISKTFEKAFFNPKVKLADFSSVQGFIAPGEDTIISPFRAAQEWGLGAAMGGILGGGQIGVSAIENIMANRDATAEYGLNFIVEGNPTITSQSELGLIRSGLESPKSSESYKYAAKMDEKFRAGKPLSPYETGRLAILNANQIAAEQDTQSVARQNARPVSNIRAGATATATGTNTLAVAEPANTAQSPARLTAQFTMPDGSLMTAQTVTGNTATTRTTPAVTRVRRTNTRFAPSNASGALQTLENNAIQLDYDDDVRSGIVTNAARIESKGADLNSVNRTGYDTAARTVKGIMRNYGSRGTSNDIGKVQRIGMSFAAADDAALDRDYIESYADVLIGVANQNGAGYEFTPAELANDVITGTTTTDAKAVSTLKDALKAIPQKDVALRAAVYGEDPVLVEQAEMLSNGDYSFIRAGEASPTQQRIAQAIQNTLDMNSPTTRGLIDNSRATTGAELVPALTEYVIRNNGVPERFAPIFTDGGAAVNAAINRSIVQAANAPEITEGATNNVINGSIPKRTDNANGNMGRAYDERASEPSGSVYGGTGAAETGRQAETVSDDRGAYTESLRESGYITQRQVNTAGGVITYNEISPEALADRADAQEIIERNAARGIDTVFFADSTNGARGFLYRGTIYIQYNNTKYTPSKINEHEYVHAKADTPAYTALKNAFVSRMTEEDRAGFEQLYATMSRRYGTEAVGYLQRMIEQNPGMSATEQGNVLFDYIMQEIIADLNAGMDEAGQYSERFANELGAFRWETMNEAQRTQTTEQENTSSEAAESPAEYAEETDAGGRFSLEDDYSRIAEINTEMRDLRGKIKEIENSDDYSRIFDLVKEDPEKFVTEYAKWLNESGYGEASKRLEELQNEHDQLIKNIDETGKQQALNDEQAAIKKSGLSEADYFRKQAVKEFGYTPYFEDAGYILPNGKMLNFSGEKGQHYGSRGQDHRAIGTIYANTTGGEAMVRFMSDGNIRIMAESPGVDLSADVAPTKEQYATIRKFVREYAPKNKYFAIDFTDKNGRTVGQYEYTNNITADKITNDIRYFYDNGKTREQSFSDVRFSKEPRFSLSPPIEETRDLIAAQNLSESKLSDALELGGLPMPSIAVTKADLGHSKFGEITLLFDKGSIDPQANKDNKIYGGDAWTPTFPNVVNKPIKEGIRALSERLGGRYSSYAYLEANFFDETSAESAKAKLKANEDVQKLFAKENGLEIKPVPQEPKYTTVKSEQMYDFLKKHTFSELVNDKTAREEYTAAYARGKSVDELPAFVQRMLEHGLTDLDKAKDNKDLYALLETEYNQNKSIAEGKPKKIINDESYEQGLKNLITEHKAEYDAFLDDIIDGTMGERYIRNNKNYYTDSGNPRSFGQLHEAYNIDNIVAHMQSELQRGQSSFMTGSANVRGAATKTYGSIDEIREDKGRLTQTTEEAAADKREEFSNRLYALAQEAVKGRNVNAFEAVDDFSGHIIDCLSKSKTKATFERKMRAYPDIYKIDDTLMQDIEQLLEDMREAPVLYFEAKPQRAVGFDEVVAAIVPDDTDETLIQRLQDHGIQVLTYKNGDSASRLEKVNSVDEVRFSKADDIHTPQFKDWFGDWENDPEHASKVVNEDGVPMVMYHGSKSSFTIFDRSKIGSTGRFEGAGFNFTPSEGRAKSYGGVVYAVYLNIKSPLSSTKVTMSVAGLAKLIREVDPTGDNIIANYARDTGDYGKESFVRRESVTTARQILEYAQNDVDVYSELSAVNPDSDSLIEKFKDLGYDGVIHYNENGSIKTAVVFDSEQIKSATDNIGTYDKTNPDIRYSIENLSTQDLLLEIANGISYRNDLIKAAKKNRSEVRELINDKQHLKDSLENAKRQMTRTKVPRANIGEVGKVTRKVLKSVSSKADIKELAPRVVDAYNTYFKEMHSAGYVESLENKAAENLALALQDVAAEIVEGGEMWTDGEDYRDLVAYLRGTPIKLTDKLKSDIHYNEFRKRNFGTLRLSDNGIPVESLWAEMRGIFPQIFNEDIANPADQLEAIEDAINRLRPKLYNPMQRHEAEAMDFIIEQFIAETDNIVEKKTKADKAYEKAQKDKEAALEKQRQDFEQKTAQFNEEAKEREDKLIQRLNEERWARYWDAEDAKADRERQKYQQYWEKRLINEKNEAEKAKIRERLDNLREQKNAQMERKVAHKDEVIANIRERRKVSIMKAHIRNTANDLSARLKNPKGAPAELVQSIAEICSKLDFSTDRTGEKTNLRLLELRSAYEAIAQDPDYDLAAEGSGIVAEMSERIKELDSVIKGKRIADLNVQELSDLNDILKEIRHAIIYANKQIGKVEARTNKELAQSVISGLDSLKDYDRNLVSKLVTGYGTQVMNSMRLAEMMSGYDEGSVLYTMFSDLNEGIRRQARLRMDFQKPFDNLVNGRGNGRLYQEFMDKPVKTGFKYSDGTDVELPKRMICEIIMLWDREQGKSHLEQGGFTVPDFKKLDAGDFKGAFEKSRLRTVGAAYQPDSEGNMVVVAGITDKDINRLRGMLDNYDKLWIRNARAFFNGRAQASLNETHMALRGRKVATAENYIPLHTNTNFVRSEIEGLSMDATIEGNGHLKSVVPNASQPVFLLGLPATVQEHIDFVSKYSGLAIPIRNFNKIYNVTTRNDSGRLDSVKNALNQKWGAGVVKYGVEQLLTDLQTSRRKASDPFSKMLGKVQSNWVAATLNGNISVCIKQAASYPTAMYVVGTKPLAKALKARAGVKHGDLLAEIDEHTGLHYLRRLGLSTQELGDRATSSAFIKRLTDKIDATLIDRGISSSILPSNWIQTVDVATTETLWLAAKYYVEDELKLSQSDPEYWDNVTQTYEAIIEETQPNYDVMHRPEIQKTTNALTRSLIMFATQPLQNSGMLYSSIGNLKAKNKALAEARMNYEKNKNKQNADFVKTAEAAQRVARGRLARSVTGLVTSAVTFTIMTALARFALHNIKRYRDEEDGGKVSMKKVVLSALDDLKSQGITMLFPAFGGTAQEFVGLVQSGFDFEIPVTQMVNDTKDAVAKFGKAWNDVNSTSAYLPPNEKLAKFKDAANDLLKIVGEFTGIPITNYENIVNGVTKYAKDIISGAAFSSDAGEYKPKYVYSYADLAGAIISGNAAKEKKIVQYFDDSGRKKENKKGKKEFDKGQLTKYLKPAYVAYVKDNPKEAARVKRSLIDRYGYTAKMIDGWLEEKKK